MISGRRKQGIKKRLVENANNARGIGVHTDSGAI
jgi:hypothetical protein